MTEADSTSTVDKKYACSTCGDEFDSGVDVCPFDGTKLTLIAQNLAAGTILGGRFEIIDRVGEGGMGAIYKATHKLMKRSVALKTIQTATMSGAALKRFQQEAQALSALSHPNILSVFDFFISDDGQPYLVMDYLEGTTLEEIRTKSGPMPWQRATNIFTQACAGLDHAHRHGIIHRDIKPSNIMLVVQEGQTDVVKIVDFGIAKLRTPDEPTEQLTATGDSFGSPQYMSPEQCHAGALDSRSDIYSLGCVMYATLTGAPPFSSGDSMQCMYKQVNEKPASFAKELGCPPALEAVVMKALEKDPANRFQTAKDMEDALRSITSGSETGDRNPAGASSESNPWKVQPTGLSRKSIAIIGGAVIACAGLAIWIKIDTAQHEPTPRPFRAAAPANAGSSSSVPAPSAISSTPAASATTEAPSAAPAPPPAVAQTPEQAYATNMDEGHKAFSAGDYEAAQRYFNAAHAAAENFGEVDSRFLESLQWQGKVAGALGDTALQKQAEHYIDRILQTKRKQGKE